MYPFPKPQNPLPNPVPLPTWMQKPQYPAPQYSAPQYSAPQYTSTVPQSTAQTFKLQTTKKDCSGTLSYTVGFALGAFLLAMVLGIAIEFLFTSSKTLDATTFKTLLFYSVICGFLVGTGTFVVHKFYCKS